MKRAYRSLPLRDRRARAEDEAFFELPDGSMRRDALCVLGLKGMRRIPITDACPAARRWLADRGLAPQEGAR
jgi:hypothetical protein